MVKIFQALVVKNLPANAGDVRGAGLIRDPEDPLEENMATHASILAWRIPWAEERGGLTVHRLRVRHCSSDLAHISSFHVFFPLS